MANSPSTDLKPHDLPAHEVRLGSVKAALWRNETETGTRYNVTFERLYRDGEQWRSTDSFGRDDLLLLAKVADLAHTWIMKPEPADRSRSPRPSSESAHDLASGSLPRRS